MAPEKLVENPTHIIGNMWRIDEDEETEIVDLTTGETVPPGIARIHRFDELPEIVSVQVAGRVYEVDASDFALENIEEE